MRPFTCISFLTTFALKRLLITSIIFYFKLGLLRLPPNQFLMASVSNIVTTVPTHSPTTIPICSLDDLKLFFSIFLTFKLLVTRSKFYRKPEGNQETTSFIFTLQIYFIRRYYSQKKHIPLQ